MLVFSHSHTNFKWLHTSCKGGTLICFKLPEHFESPQFYFEGQTSEEEKCIVTRQADSETFTGSRPRLFGLRWSALILFISGWFVWYHFVIYCFVWGFFCSDAVFSAALSDLQLTDASDVALFLPVVWGRSLERMLPFWPESARVCPKKTRSTSQRVPLLCVISACLLFFRVTHSQLLCTAGTLSIMIYLCNLAVKCTQLATWMGIKEPAPGSDNTSEMERWVGIVEDSLCCDTEGTLWRSNACEGAPRSCQSSTIKTSMSPRHSKEIMRKGFL